MKVYVTITTMRSKEGLTFEVQEARSKLDDARDRVLGQAEAEGVMLDPVPLDDGDTNMVHAWRTHNVIVSIHELEVDEVDA